MTANRAAWLPTKAAYPFKFDVSEMPEPAADEVVIKNHVVAINPLDWKIQSGHLIDKFPIIIGGDVAGQVHAVGTAVDRLKVGDRVAGQTTCFTTEKLAHGGFQLYTAVPQTIVSKIPSNTSYAEASVFPIAISTAMVALYSPDHLDLPLPSLEPRDTGKVIVVWGGAGSVGTTILQLARASGVSVITTASSRNHDSVKSAGATIAIDYKSSTVADGIVRAIKDSGKQLTGIVDTISLEESAVPIRAVYDQLGDGESPRLVSLLHPYNGWISDDIEPRFAFSLDVLDKYTNVADHVWGKFLYRALEAGVVKPLPEPLVVGKGLEFVQKAVDLNKAGVSAKKVVVEL
ncbi:Alcohol dehydrogenase GroES-like domain-containing protein 10 [Elsinoe fawcettii]|nr:Alcohol dehydrogenase GroES-like domain-containing protein 10 [Elsinoe fawcettii]